MSKAQRQKIWVDEQQRAWLLKDLRQQHAVMAADLEVASMPLAQVLRPRVERLERQIATLAETVARHGISPASPEAGALPPESAYTARDLDDE